MGWGGAKVEGNRNTIVFLHAFCKKRKQPLLADHKIHVCQIQYSDIFLCKNVCIGLRFSNLAAVRVSDLHITGFPNYGRF